MRPPTMAEVAAAFDPESGISINELDKESAAYQRTRRIEQTFTAGVEFLRSADNERIRSLGGAIWDVFHHGHVVVTVPMGDVGVSTLHFALALYRGRKEARVFAPRNWAEMAESDPTMQRGAIVMVGSHAVDFYNGRFDRDSATRIGDRAHCYEAEYLRSLADRGTLNDYQNGLLKRYPRFDRRFEYKRKPVTGMN